MLDMLRCMLNDKSYQAQPPGLPKFYLGWFPLPPFWGDVYARTHQVSLSAGPNAGEHRSATRRPGGGLFLIFAEDSERERERERERAQRFLARLGGRPLRTTTKHWLRAWFVTKTHAHTFVSCASLCLQAGFANVRIQLLRR